MDDHVFVTRLTRPTEIDSKIDKLYFWTNDDNAILTPTTSSFRLLHYRVQTDRTVEISVHKRRDKQTKMTKIVGNLTIFCIYHRVLLFFDRYGIPSQTHPWMEVIMGPVNSSKCWACLKSKNTRFWTQKIVSFPMSM